MKIEETAQIGVYVFSKTALRIGRHLASATQRLQVNGLNGVKGCVLGRFRMTSRLEKQGDRRWYLPVWSLVGKLGQDNGPSLAAVLGLAEMRKAFKAGIPPSRWRSKDRRHRRRRRSRDRSMTGRRRRRRMTATRMTTATTSTSPLRKQHPPTAPGIADQTSF